MKIVSLPGSPGKNADSSIVAERFCTAVQCLGAEVRAFTLTLNDDLTCRGCRKYTACRIKLHRCAVEDDLTPVLEAIREADAPATVSQVVLTACVEPVNAVTVPTSIRAGSSMIHVCWGFRVAECYVQSRDLERGANCLFRLDNSRRPVAGSFHFKAFRRCVAVVRTATPFRDGSLLCAANPILA